MYQMIDVTRSVLKACEHRAQQNEEHLFNLKAELDHHQRVATENQRGPQYHSPVREDKWTGITQLDYAEANVRSWRRCHEAIDQTTNEWEVAVDGAIKKMKRISSEKTQNSFDLAQRIVSAAQNRLSMLTLRINQTTNTPK